jgi:hypothetical protein
MAVLIQPVILDLEYSFVLHTRDPISKSGTVVELAVGQGETLASANMPGQPYRVLITEDAKIETFANYSFKASAEMIDYSKIDFSNNPEMLR